MRKGGYVSAVETLSQTYPEEKSGMLVAGSGPKEVLVLTQEHEKMLDEMRKTQSKLS